MPTPIQNPAGYAVTRAIAYADVDGSMVQVAAAAPLPVSIGASAATTPLAGTSSTSTVAGPYQPALGRAVILALSGTWSGTVTVTRSTDGGTTRLPRGNCACSTFRSDIARPRLANKPRM